MKFWDVDVNEKWKHFLKNVLFILDKIKYSPKLDAISHNYVVKHCTIYLYI